jgi:hypothetical protein
MTTSLNDIVADPVSHISISGVHGREELDARLARAPKRVAIKISPLGALVLGAALGAVAVYLLKRD